jgi:hypothetical protein
MIKASSDVGLFDHLMKSTQTRGEGDCLACDVTAAARLRVIRL